jgi:hypothetical protein
MADVYRRVKGVCAVNDVQVEKRLFLDKVSDKRLMFTYVKSVIQPQVRNT